MNKHMPEFDRTVAAWNTPDYESVLKSEIEALSLDQLPLQQGLSHSNVALDDNIKAVILNVEHDEQVIHVKAGLFYEGIIAGCSCADDPTPVDRQPEYCEVMLDIDRASAGFCVKLIG